MCFASISASLALPDTDLPADAVLDEPLHADFLERIRDAVGPDVEDPGLAYTWAKRGVHRLVRREAVALRPRPGRASARSRRASSTRPWGARRPTPTT